MTADSAAAIVCHELHKTFRRETGECVEALCGLSWSAERGSLTALVGPDGAGKTTLIRLIAGLMTPDSGDLQVLGIDVRRQPQAVQNRLGYMPQRFGLYEDLTVQENLDLYADLHGVPAAQRRARYDQLMQMTALGPFVNRLAGQLSGGMKQKLGLACALVRSPDLLLLDEPTVGVDPLSRRELWEIILHLVNEQKITALVATSYLDEAERCSQSVVLYQGQILAQGTPAEVTQLAADRSFLVEPANGQSARAVQTRLLRAAGVVEAVPQGGHVRVVLEQPQAEHETVIGAWPAARVAPRFEDGFMVLLAQRTEKSADLGEQPEKLTPRRKPQPESQHVQVIEVRDLSRQFGEFTAVDHISFTVYRNEIFGLLGPNGAGKTTTFRMLCGLLPATSGTLRVAGVDVRRARASARERIGYVAQKFSLYGQLTVAENLDFFASAYNLRGSRKRDRIAWALDEFELSKHRTLPSGQLPGGYKQRLAMAAALLHEPEILFLDEPTSGADPLARRDFWQRISELADRGVTVIITTHFIEEAEYCDRVVILDSGKILARGTPAEIRRRAPAVPGREPDMEDAFVAIVQAARQADRPSTAEGAA
ncbi:MAG TPA: ATP-binding cassette domain-containing protein [Pirellulales bacterium]|nr:ATP-binding cassette domain-containing protein [Pirellulales bacterium]